MARRMIVEQGLFERTVIVIQGVMGQGVEALACPTIVAVVELKCGFEEKLGGRGPAPLGGCIELMGQEGPVLELIEGFPVMKVEGAKLGGRPLVGGVQELLPGGDGQARR